MSDSDGPLTRSRAHHLDLPRGGSRPPPRPGSPLAQERFTYPPSPTPSSMADAEAERIRALVEAATTAALAAYRAEGGQRKRPELPEFDPSNIDIWVKRIESAYIRSNITKPADKFAFLEPKFPVDKDPKINQFLYGDSTEQNWQAFLTYLKERYGKSTRQQTKLFMRGFQRDGRTPTDMMIHMKEETKKVTLDSLYKEMLFSSLPADIQRAMADKVETLDADATAKLADSYFDKDGKVLVPSTTINSVEPSLEDVDEEIQDAEVNAIPRRQQSSFRPRGKSAHFRQGSGRGHPSSQPSNASSTPPASASSSFSKPPGKSALKKICRFHLKFKENAYSCEQGCVHWDSQKFAGNGGASHRQ